MLRKNHLQYSFSVSLNGEHLGDLDPRIRLVEVSEIPAEETVTIRRALTDGDPVALVRRQRLDVRLSLFLKEPGAAAKSALISRISAFFRPGGVLTASWRPGLQLHVDTASLPGIPGLLAWNQTMDVTLNASAGPYWEDAEPVTLRQEIRRGSVTVTPPGQLPYTALEADFQNVATQVLQVLEIQVYAGEERVSYLSLSGLSVQTGEHVTIGYDARGFLTIQAAGKSALSARSAASSDALRVKTGVPNEIRIDSPRNLNMILRMRGRYF